MDRVARSLVGQLSRLECTIAQTLLPVLVITSDGSQYPECKTRRQEGFFKQSVLQRRTHKARAGSFSKIRVMVQSLRMLIFAVLVAFTVSAFAADGSDLKPPPGAKVAIVVFEDLQCPDCSRAYPMVWETANSHNVPVVLHDFPLPMHNWAFDAAVWARYFDKKSVALGNEFRKFVYAKQVQVSRDNLSQWAQKFADDNIIALPYANDPGGKLAELVKADFALGQRIGVEHTPTIWVVGNSGVSQPLVEEVKDRDKLGKMIDDMLARAQTAPTAKGSANRKSSVKNP
jgi:protein-disulfide isomerase